MSAFVLAEPAEQDLTEIWDYIAADNLEAADRVLDAIASAFARLAERPEMGPHTARTWPTSPSVSTPCIRTCSSIDGRRGRCRSSESCTAHATSVPFLTRATDFDKVTRF